MCNGTTSSFYGPICACAGVTPPQFATCTAPLSYPEQINLQIASSTVVVVSFVTFEEQLPASPPTVQLVAPNGSTVNLTGVAHLYTTSHAAHSQFCDESSPDSIRCLRRNYTMSFVKLSGLTPRQRYESGLQNFGGRIVLRPWKRMSSFWRSEWGEQILVPFQPKPNTPF